MSDIAIRVEGLGKRYRLGERAPYKTLRETITRAVAAPFRALGSRAGADAELRPRDGQHIWALKDVSLEVKRGEAVGIIGRNGSGKSTLLKILARVTEPTRGVAEIQGRVGSLLEVGTGFHPELTGRENIYLNGAILGMTKGEIQRRFDEIVAFAEIERFLDTPVKRYSSGMYVRLAFAVAGHLEPEILLVDEVLAVGDASFQRKCLSRMGTLIGEGRTIVFVTHNTQAVKTLCPRTLWLEGGLPKLSGATAEVADEYMAGVLGRPTSKATFPEEPTRRIQFTEAELVLPGSPTRHEGVLLRFQYSVYREAEGTLLCVEVQTPDGLCVFYTNDEGLPDPRKRRIGRHQAEVSIPVHLLAPGDYRVAFGFWEPPDNPPDHFPDVRLTFRQEAGDQHSRFSVHGIRRPGVLVCPATWEYSEAEHP